MEDPWSTPWAVETPSASPGLAPTKPKTAALPGTGTITPTEGRLDISSAFDNSPWGAAITNGFDVTHTPRDESEGQDGWGGWDDGKHNAWGSKQTETMDMATSRDSLDHFSAPWASVDTEQDCRLGGATDSAVSFGEQAKQEVETAQVGASEHDTKANAAMLLEDEQDAWTAPREGVVAPSRAIAHDAKSTTLDKDAVLVEEPETIDDVNQPADGETITEDSQLDSQTQQQKASKVQELVNMYDGIAKKTVRPPPDTISRESRSGGSPKAIQGDLTTQEFVSKESSFLEPETESKSSEGDNESAASATTETSSTKDIDVAGDDQAYSDSYIDEATSSTLVEAVQDATSNDEATTRPAKGEQQPHSPRISNSKDSPYPIDLANLEALFPGFKPATTNPEPVPDVIIDNSYTTISERKTWYRISRFGSTRKHDSGEEDNYKRITWAASEVRTKTLHIVRRWMEQDSITGRVVLGSRKAGPLGASMFNWDSSEPQIEIGELLRQRVHKSGSSGGGHARNRSLPQADMLPQTPTLEEFGGWGANASMPSTPSAVVQSPQFAAQMKERTGSALRPPPDAPAEMPRSPWDDDRQETQQERKSSTDLVPSPPMAATADTLPPESSGEPALLEAEPINTEEEDDDDDWGEMVSSPTISSSAAFAPLSAPAELKPAPVQQVVEADFSGLDFFESSAPKAVRANPPRPILTSGVEVAAPSPAWTPTMNSPTLEPMRVSMNNVRAQSAVVTSTIASTPILKAPLEAPRTSMHGDRMSTEGAWISAVSTAATNHGLSVDCAWAPVDATSALSTTPSADETKHGTGKKVSFDGTCTVGENAAVEEALRSLPDLSYMLQ